jgi:hypothetical protein
METDYRTTRKRPGVRRSSGAFGVPGILPLSLGHRRPDGVFLLGAPTQSKVLRKAPEDWSTPGRCRDFA